jgi:sporulation and spore germination protein
MSRAFRITLLLLALAVLVGLYEFPALRRQLVGSERQEQTEEQARREVIRAASEGRQEQKEKVAIFWLSADDPRELAAVETPLSLGADPVERARVALETLITGAPTPEQRPLPLDTSLLAIYLLADGTAVADFSDALSHEIPSGISTEQLAVDAIARTLHAAVPQAVRLKILIAGQEVETLAGHVDLMEAFDLGAMSPAAPGRALPAPAAAPPQPAQPGKTPAPEEKKTPPAPKPQAGER